MKQCTYCGKEYPDEATVCAIDERPLRKAVPPKNVQEHSDSSLIFPFVISRSLRRHYQREAQSLAASKPARICACGTTLLPTQVDQSYLWGIIPFGDTITYICPKCRTSVAITSPLRFGIFSVFLILFGWAFLVCIWLLIHRQENENVAGVIIGAIITGLLFGLFFYFQADAMRSWLKYRRHRRDSTVMAQSPLNTSEQLLCQGVNAANFQRWGEALTYFDRALEINPNFGEAWLRRGVALISMQRFPDAIASFEKADQLGQKEAEKLLNYWRTKIRS
jgi:hypothetical protein